MGRQEEDIQRKLVELEASLEKEELVRPPLVRPTSTVESKDEQGWSADAYSLCGYILLAIGMIMLFSHIRIGTGMLTLFGLGTHIGIVILPLLVGIGMMLYNPKSKLAQIVAVVGVGILLFTMLMQLVMSFPTLTLLEFLIMLGPLMGGIVCLIKARAKMMDNDKSDKTDK